MIFSTVIAFIIPFELFLFAYAVLGPLHYLTEISWLHDRGYFTKNKYDYLFLAILCLLLLIVSYIIKQQPSVGNGIIYVAFLSALVMILVESNAIKLLSLVLITVSIVFRSKAFDSIMSTRKFCAMRIFRFATLNPSVGLNWSLAP